MTTPGRSRASRTSASVSARSLCIVMTLWTTTRSAFANIGRSLRSRRSTSASRGGSRPRDAAATARDAIAALASPDAECDARIEEAHIANVDAIEPRRERGVEQEALRVQVRLHPEERAQAEKDHPRGPRLRDARHEVVGRPRREPEIPLETAPELGKLRVRKAAAGLDQRAHHLGRLLALTVAREALNDERVVVRPHRSVVVAHRVVRRALARERPDAPPGVHAELHEAPPPRGAVCG